MKLKLTVLFLTAATLLGCSKPERVEKPGDGTSEIGFFAGLSTRGTAVTTPSLLAGAGGFCVWSYVHTGPWATATNKHILINNTGHGYGEVTSSDNGVTWDYGTPRIWPLDFVSFFAYAPYGEATPFALNAQGVPQISYTVDEEVADQIDLLIADQVLDRLGPNPVTELFQHALSRIRFTALKSTTQHDEDIKITMIGLKNLYDSGTTAVQTPVSWTPIGTATAEYMVSGALLRDIELDDTTGVGAQEMLVANQNLFLLPQTLPSASEIIVTYKINELELSWSGPIPSVAWEAGKSYNYQLLIEGSVVMVICGQLESPTSGNWGTD